MPSARPLVLATVKPDKCGGRHLARVVAAGPDGESVDVALELISDLWGAAWSGRGTPPKPPWPRPAFDEPWRRSVD